MCIVDDGDVVFTADDDAGVVVVVADRYKLSTLVVEACQCCRLLMFACLPRFKTLSLLSHSLAKESERSLSGRCRPEHQLHVVAVRGSRSRLEGRRVDGDPGF